MRVRLGSPPNSTSARRAGAAHDLYGGMPGVTSLRIQVTNHHHSEAAMSEINTVPDKDSDKDSEHGIEITINGHPYVAPKKHMTGRELLHLAGLPEANHLFLEVPGPGDDPPVEPDKKIKLRKGMAFYDVPVGTFG